METQPLSDKEKFYLISLIRDKPTIWDSSHGLSWKNKHDEFNSLVDDMSKALKREFTGFSLKIFLWCSGKILVLSRVEVRTFSTGTFLFQQLYPWFSSLTHCFCGLVGKSLFISFKWVKVRTLFSKNIFILPVLTFILLFASFYPSKQPFFNFSSHFSSKFLAYFEHLFLSRASKAWLQMEIFSRNGFS